MTSPFATNPRDIDKTTIPSIDFHLHTNWTDGEDSIAVVYQAAVDAGLNTILFSEHGRRTSVDWFPDFAEKIRDLPMEPCRALVGVESKIEDREGNLDVADEMVNAADLVMASVHRFPGPDGTPIPFEEMDTNDVAELEFQLSWAALSNPVIDILGHPFGMSLRRFGVTCTTDAWVEWDLGDWKTPEELDAMFPSIDAIVHAGAAISNKDRLIYNKAMLDTNVRSCLCLGEWALARGIPVVFLSSSTVYAEPETNGIRKNAPCSSGGLGGLYGISKFQAEGIFDYLSECGLSVAVLRPSSIYGSGLPDNQMVSRFLATATDNQTIELSPPADDRVDLVHASDVARAVSLTLEKETWETFNISSGGPVMIEEIAQACVQAVGAGSVAVSTEPAKRKAITRFGLDIKKAQSMLEYCPQVTLDDGLRRMVLN